ncbi:hypothetical protein NIES2104_19030 [Leptolyngbya sp. NIES-2104]|nr:hypothetical protein NIES2104_19030 [Leptolyngbya sp. NIES-2104]
MLKLDAMQFLTLLNRRNHWWSVAARTSSSTHMDSDYTTEVLWQKSGKA